MEDLVRDLALGFLGLVFTSGFLQTRAEHAIRREVGAVVRGAHVEARVRPDGLFGLLAGRARRVLVLCQGGAADSLSFPLRPGGGTRARAEHLVIEIRGVTFRGVKVERFHADVPSVTLDAWRVVFDGRIVLRGAGMGPAEVVLSEGELPGYLASRFPQLGDVSVSLQPGRASIRATTLVLGARLAMEATGRLEARDGRYVRIADGEIRLNGRPLTAEAARRMLDGLNPVLDTHRDLGLDGFFRLDRVETVRGAVVGRGTATVPGPAAPGKDL